MLKTLYGKLALTLFAVFCLIGTVYILFTLFTTRMFLQEVNQKLNRSLAEQLVAEKSLMLEGKVQEEALKDIFHMLMVINPNIEVYLLDPGGNILSYSAPPGAVRRETVSLEPVRRFLSGEHSLPILGDNPKEAGGRKVFSAAPVYSGDTLQGYLYVILGGEEFDSAAGMLQGSYILRLSAWAAAGGLVFAFLTGLLLFDRLTRRLKSLSRAMVQFQKDNFSKPLPETQRYRPTGKDEIDRLGETFNDMADRILAQVNHLKEVDAFRREMVANVSHDLRTPMAALQGYLETLLLKEDSLTPEQRRQYLDIALKKGERLNRLVSELFELARLDAKETTPRREPFSPAELVQDVVQKFRLDAEAKEIRFETNLSRELPFVFADIGLIERVLENLIENALRFTPAGGTVSVRLQKGKEPPREGSLTGPEKPSGPSAPEDRVTISVSDTGCGIPEEDLPKIFQRFYQIDRNRPGGGGHSGLGLAISQKILELHGSDIAVQSRPGQGTTLTFHLPVFRN